MCVGFLVIKQRKLGVSKRDLLLFVPADRGINLGENVRSVDRIFDLLEILGQSDREISITELSARAGLSKTTAFRLVQMMCLRGYAEKTQDAKYILGPKVLELAGYHLNALELQTAAQPFLSDLYADLHLTVHLGKLVDTKVVYLELLNQNLPMKSGNEGIRVDAFTSSIGKCLLACESGNKVDELLECHHLKKYTENTITDPALYKEHLRQIRRQGWAMDNGEYLPDRRCVGAPVFDHSGAPVACVSVSGSIREITDEKLMAVVGEVRDTAMQISRRMGYVP